MPKILIRVICLVVVSVTSAFQSYAQCNTKELVNGKSILRGTGDYIYLRADESYLGMTFTVEKDEKNNYKLTIKTDASNDFTEPDSTVVEMEDKSQMTFALTPGISSIGDGGLKSTTVQVNISQNDLQRIAGRKVVGVSAYRKGSRIDLPVYDERFLRHQFECLK